MRRLVIAFAIVLAAVPAAHAQQVAGSPRDSARAAALARLPVGAVVRVRAGEDAFAHHVGTVLAARRDGIVLLRAGGDTMHVAAAEIEGLQRSRGRRTANQAMGRGAAYGLIVGLGVGGIATGLAGAYERRHPCRDCMFTATIIVGAASVAFTAASTVVGGMIGLAHREKWLHEWPPRR